MAKLMVPLKPEDEKALRKLARAEYRNPHDQAAVMLRDDLKRRGLIKDDQQTERGTTNDD